MTATKRCVTDLFLPCSLQCLQVDTSHYTEGITLTISDEFSLSTPPDISQYTPPLIVSDEVVLQHNHSDVQVQPISHLLNRPSNSGEYYMLHMYTFFI